MEEWNRLYGKSSPPAFDDISGYIGSELWENLNSFLQSTYNVQPKLSHSCCSMQPGWNVKYFKRGRSLCTLYPMEGFFFALVVIGSREVQETEQILPSLGTETRKLYEKAVYSMGSRWLMIPVKSTTDLNDVIRLIRIRAGNQ